MGDFFKDENDMKELFLEWLRKEGFITRRGIRIHNIEMDIVGLSKCKITREGVIKDPNEYVFSFEVKVATSFQLKKYVIEQAIVRLVFADFVYMVTPKEAEIWVDEKRKKTIHPAMDVLKMANGAYSKKIGVIALGPDGSIRIIREAGKSGITIGILREMLKSELYKQNQTRGLGEFI